MQDMGFSYVIAKDGKEVLEKLGKEKFDLILMDINMPIMDGMTVVSEIRNRQDSLKSIPIILLTAFGSKEKREKSFLGFGLPVNLKF